MCSKSNTPISLLYISCTTANLYFSFFKPIGYLYTLAMIILQALLVFFFLYQAWSGGDRAQEKLKEYVIGQGEAAAKKAMTASGAGRSSFQDQMMQMTINSVLKNR